MEKEFAAIKSFLDGHNINYKVFQHAPVFTSEQAAAVRGFELKTGVKALVFKIQKEKYYDIILILIRGDHKVDNKKLSKLLNVKNTKLASPEEVLEKTGCEVGSVHPFGNLVELKTYMDKEILKNKIIAFNAGLHTVSITMKPEDFVRIVKPDIVNIAK